MFARIPIWRNRPTKEKTTKEKLAWASDVLRHVFLIMAALAGAVAAGLAFVVGLFTLEDWGVLDLLFIVLLFFVVPVLVTTVVSRLLRKQ